MVIELFATFDFWRIDKTLVNSNQKNDTLFHKKMFFFFMYKRILDCISSKISLERVSKILISFVFSLCFENDKRLRCSNFDII